MLVNIMRSRIIQTGTKEIRDFWIYSNGIEEMMADTIALFQVAAVKIALLQRIN